MVQVRATAQICERLRRVMQNYMLALCGVLFFVVFIVHTGNANESAPHKETHNFLESAQVIVSNSRSPIMSPVLETIYEASTAVLPIVLNADPSDNFAVLCVKFARKFEVPCPSAQLMRVSVRDTTL